MEKSRKMAKNKYYYYKRKKKYTSSKRCAQRDYTNTEYSNFRKYIRRRDKKCKYPGCCVHKYCEVHHIIPWAASPHLRFEKTNGILLCKEHHKQVTNFEYLYIELFTRIVQQEEKIYSNRLKKKKYKKRGRPKKDDYN